ncbi:MAG: DUF1343 domain-containing protein [Bacteroidales bacterium]|nr:DUF1343 domain-containing protein [Bacteroidales bacterium]
MKKTVLMLSIACVVTLCCFCCTQSKNEAPVITGAQQTEAYLHLLQGKRVGILTNHSATIGDTHLVDSLVALGINVQAIFAPEHGFRGTASGTIPDEIDPKTGIPIISLYGQYRMATDAMMEMVDIMVYDIQDVGLRFYTYLSSMYNMMESCARNHVPLVILDRPNPNGHYVDGPILDTAKYRSFVGVIPIPVVHGMTLGEMAGMINGEKWLIGGLQCDVTVIKCKNYTHQTLYELPIKPSPNLPNIRSIYLYPALCPFEGTPVSMGRGSDLPFQVYGHPDMTGYDFSYVAMNRRDSTIRTYYGVDLSTEPSNEEIFKDGFTLKYVIDAYQNLKDKPAGVDFLRENGSFNRLVGVSYIREMILADKTAEEIKACWQDDVVKFEKDRAPYLLYPL